ncbi:MAG: hypothetical protein H7Y17_15280 [Chlorobia bacterium]|nr:hypothetical protein [Fimbriimonadaceae bacterium]
MKSAPNDGSLDGLRKKPNSKRNVDLGRENSKVGVARPPKLFARVDLGQFGQRANPQGFKRREPATEWRIELKPSQEV